MSTRPTAKPNDAYKLATANTITTQVDFGDTLDAVDKRNITTALNDNENADSTEENEGEVTKYKPGYTDVVDTGMKHWNEGIKNAARKVNDAPNTFATA